MIVEQINPSYKKKKWQSTVDSNKLQVVLPFSVPIYSPADMDSHC